MKYYLKRMRDGAIVDGPWDDRQIAAVMVDLQRKPAEFGTISRLELIREGFPMTRTGEILIEGELSRYKNPTVVHIHKIPHIVAEIHASHEFYQSGWILETRCSGFFPLSEVYEYGRSLDERVEGVHAILDLKGA